jgi:peptidoglycan hydrolase CwlO-like protein
MKCKYCGSTMVVHVEEMKKVQDKVRNRDDKIEYLNGKIKELRCQIADLGGEDIDMIWG